MDSARILATGIPAAVRHSRPKHRRTAVLGPRPMRVAGLACCALLVWGVGGCRRPPTAETPAAVAGHPVARTRTQRGPVTVTVEVTPAPARLSDEPVLTLTIEAQQGVEVQPPPFGEAVGDFLIRDFQNQLPRTTEQRQILRQVYTLEPTRAGPLQVDPITVRFRDGRPGGDGQEHVLQTEALAVEVESMLGDTAPTLADLQGIDAPLELPSSRPAWFWSLPVLAVLATLITAFVLLRRQRAAVSVETALSPHARARQELEALIRARLSETDVKQFYAELTGIVRRFIESTTGIHAPEQTTEEFLREIGQGHVFSGDERERLKWFLESADLVKFAAHQPAAEDIERAIERARKFIGLTDAEAVA